MDFSGKFRHPQPKKLLTGDIVKVMTEDKYEDLIGSTLVIGEVLNIREYEDGRIYELCFFNGKPLRVYPDGETAFIVYTKRENIELEMRTEYGEDVYYQRTNVVPVAQADLEDKWPVPLWILKFIKVILKAIAY